MSSNIIKILVAVFAFASIASDKIDWKLLCVKMPKSSNQKTIINENFNHDINKYKQEIYTQPRYNRVIGYTEYFCPTRR